MSNPVFLLFSGHNDRAVITLCRFFSRYKLSFVIVASASSDAIFKTSWADRVILCRLDQTLDLVLFKQICIASRPNLEVYQELVYCPTSEFMNHFILDQRCDLELMGLTLNMPSRDVYLKLTNKETSAVIVNKISGLRSPPLLEWSNLSTPCVFKPKENVAQNGIRYPRLCLTPEDLAYAVNELDPEHWFVQAYISGQSHYLCGFLSKSGVNSYYWQLNLLQQAGGKSIVLARTETNPGVNVDILFAGLSKIGYFGPFMMEIIYGEDGQFYYIEINPRFWGPLQLALDACSEVLEMFVIEAGGEIKRPLFSNKQKSWYAWKTGAHLSECRSYPALVDVTVSEIKYLLSSHDVYAEEDTKLLQNKF